MSVQGSAGLFFYHSMSAVFDDTTRDCLRQVLKLFERPHAHRMISAQIARLSSAKRRATRLSGDAASANSSNSCGFGFFPFKSAIPMRRSWPVARECRTAENRAQSGGVGTNRYIFMRTNEKKIYAACRHGILDAWSTRAKGSYFPRRNGISGESRNPKYGFAGPTNSQERRSEWIQPY
jgi:hypothetical protein